MRASHASGAGRRVPASERVTGSGGQSPPDEASSIRLLTVCLPPPSILALKPTPQAQTPYGPLLIVGLGGLFFGVTGPLLSNFVPPLVRDALGEHRALIGTVMAIDNVLLLLLVPWAGAASDRASARGRGRLPIVLSGLVLAAVGMAFFPASARFGIAGLIGAIVVLYSGVNIVRSPSQALVADLVPSRYRSLATGSVMFQMCVGAIVFLMLGKMLGMQPAFLIASGTVLADRRRVRLRATRAGGIGDGRC